MSGGHFGYLQFRIKEIEEQLNDELQKNEHGYSEQTVKNLLFIEAKLNEVFQMVHSMDYLFECDIGEDTFNQRMDTLK